MKEGAASPVSTGLGWLAIRMRMIRKVSDGGGARG